MTTMIIDSSPNWIDVWNGCRNLNQYIGIVASVFVGYRLIFMALDHERWKFARAFHLLAWFTYVSASLIIGSLAAYHYNDSPTDANWTSGARLLLSLVAIVLCLWWPHPTRFVPVENGNGYAEEEETEDATG